MPANVTVRINPITGQCEVLVEHESNLPAEQHNADGEAITAGVGRLFDRAPNVREVTVKEPRPEPTPPKPTPTPPTPTPSTPVEDTDKTPDRARRRG